MIKGAIFDLDGTLVDSMSIWRHVAISILKDNGLTPTDEFIVDFLHCSVSEVAEIMRRDFCIEKSEEDLISATYECIARYYNQEACLKPGVVDLLDSFKAKGIKISIASMTDRSNVESVLANFNLTKYFDHIVTSELTKCSKSELKFFQVCLNLMGIQPSEAVFFEDSLRAGITIKKIGSFLCGLYDSIWGNEISDKLKAIADVYAQDLSHIRFKHDNVFVV